MLGNDFRQECSANALGLPTFLDPESRRDVRDWQEACVRKTNDRDQCGEACSEGARPERNGNPKLCAVLGAYSSMKPYSTLQSITILDMDVDCYNYSFTPNFFLYLFGIQVCFLIVFCGDSLNSKF